MSLSNGAQVSDEYVSMHGVDGCEGDNLDVDETSANRELGVEVSVSEERRVQSQGDGTQNPLVHLDNGLSNRPGVLDSRAMSDGKTNEVQSDVPGCSVDNTQDMVSDQRDGTAIPELFGIGSRVDLDTVGRVLGLALENVQDPALGNVHLMLTRICPATNEAEYRSGIVRMLERFSVKLYAIQRKTKMNKKALAILMRARMRPNHHTNFPLPPISNDVNQLLSNSNSQGTQSGSNGHGNGKLNNQRSFEAVRESMHSAISMHKTEVLDSVLNDFSEGYFSLSFENRKKLLLTLAKEYDLNRTQVRELIKQYLGLQPPGNEAQSGGVEDEVSLTTFYRIERNLRHSLKPVYETLFERINSHPEGLKFLTILRADILSVLVEGNIASLRAMDSNLKDKLSTWLSPAALELHQITWDDPASLLEKIVAYEAVHPISNLIDLKRRLGIGRRCFAYFHSAIPCEPLIFIEVALLKNIAETIQEVLWDHPPIAESEAACALFYSISSTQPGLAGINLGKFLIKRVITLVKRDMPHISVFATLSPIPGFMPWLLNQDLLKQRTYSLGDLAAGKSGMEILLNVLTSTTHEWTDSDKLLSALKPPLMRLCTRYLLQEKKRGKALDSVANFHLQNGAMVQRINWMADRSEKGLSQSAGIMVNYVYRTENIEEYAQSYFSKGHIHSSDEVKQYTQPLAKNESKDSLG
ncbi:hypothetical protein V6N12_019698 [Hibiscus sabdariffa]|uniref:Malonyl-CoA decarboxylase n=1 Tax=Hibiscus sabdariffa TaxID=183260 RepID=A0ABR2B548_9ROSI